MIATVLLCGVFNRYICSTDEAATGTDDNLASKKNNLTVEINELVNASSEIFSSYALGALSDERYIELGQVFSSELIQDKVMNSSFEAQMALIGAIVTDSSIYNKYIKWIMENLRNIKMSEEIKALLKNEVLKGDVHLRIKEARRIGLFVENTSRKLTETCMIKEYDQDDAFAKRLCDLFDIYISLKQLNTLKHIENEEIEFIRELLENDKILYHIYNVLIGKNSITDLFYNSFLTELLIEKLISNGYFLFSDSIKVLIKQYVNRNLLRDYIDRYNAGKDEYSLSDKFLLKIFRGNSHKDTCFVKAFKTVFTAGSLNEFTALFEHIHSLRITYRCITDKSILNEFVAFIKREIFRSSDFDFSALCFAFHELIIEGHNYDESFFSDQMISRKFTELAQELVDTAKYAELNRLRGLLASYNQFAQCPFYINLQLTKEFYLGAILQCFKPGNSFKLPIWLIKAHCTAKWGEQLKNELLFTKYLDSLFTVSKLPILDELSTSFEQAGLSFIKALIYERKYLTHELVSQLVAQEQLNNLKILRKIMPSIDTDVLPTEKFIELICMDIILRRKISSVVEYIFSINVNVKEEVEKRMKPAI